MVEKMTSGATEAMEDSVFSADNLTSMVERHCWRDKFSRQNSDDGL